MYQALYRKYRPRSFSDVVGQLHITETLRAQMKNDRLSHAYLFVGTRGTGKTTCAKILSRVVNCQNPVDGDACNKCESCMGIENGSIHDVLEIDAASNNGVDNIRALREEAVYVPALVKKRIYIVDEVHMLSTSAFNALLKILEEPPEHLIFILATTELHKVPATIMSRCQRFMFRRISKDAISARLDEIATKEKIALTEDASKKLAILADGSMRDAISLFDQCAAGETVDIERVLDTIGLAGAQEVFRLAGAIADRDINSTLGILDKLYDDGRDMLSLLNELGALMRDMLVYNLSPNSPLVAAVHNRGELTELSKKYSSERLLFNLELIRDAAYNLTRSGAMKLTAQMCLIRMCDERLSENVSALMSRVEELERREERGERREESFYGSEPMEERLANAECRMQNAELDSESDLSVIADNDPQSPEKSEAVTKAEVIVKVGDLEQRGKRKEENDEPHDVSETDPNFQLSTFNSQLNQASRPESSEEPLVLEPEAKSETESEDFWTDILELLKREPSLYPVVSNEDKVWAEMHDGYILIYASDPFTISQLEMDVFLEPIKEAAKKVLGREAIIRVEPGKRISKAESKTSKPDESDESDESNTANKPDTSKKIDALINTFSNITYEE